MSAGVVLHVVLTRGPGGTERQVTELCGGLRARGWETHIAAPSSAHPAVLRGYSRAARLHLLPTGFLPGTIVQVRRLARGIRPTVIHGHYGTAILASVLASRGTPSVTATTLHLLELAHSRRRSAWLQRPLYRALMQRVDIVLAISTAVAERAVADGMVAPSRVRVVPNGVGDHPMTATARGGHFLYLGRLEPEKRGRLAIQAVAAQHDAKLLIAGVGSEEPELRRLADDLMPGRCEFLGYVEEPTPLLAACRALLVPSASEGFGLVAIEAMAQATPVVGFHESGGLRDVIVNGSTGFLVDDDDEGGFTRAVALLLRDGRLAESMGAAGRQRYESLFTVDRVAEATIDAYSAPR